MSGQKEDEEMSTEESNSEGRTKKELDILKDLPSFNKDNFSRYTPSGGSLNKVRYLCVCCRYHFH